MLLLLLFMLAAIQYLSFCSSLPGRAITCWRSRIFKGWQRFFFTSWILFSYQNVMTALKLSLTGHNKMRNVGVTAHIFRKFSLEGTHSGALSSE